MKTLHTIKLMLTIHCDDASRLASDGLDRELTRSERAILRWHLFVCHRCRRFLQQIELLRQLVQRMPELWRTAAHNNVSVHLSPERRRQIKQALSAAQRLEAQ